MTKYHKAHLQDTKFLFFLIACLSVCKLFTFLSSPPNPVETNFNQTWQAQSILGEGIQVCSNEGPHPFPRGDNYEMAKIY